MKKHLLLTLLIIYSVLLNLSGQTYSNSITIVGGIFGDLNMEQINIRYKTNPTAHFIVESDSNGLEQIKEVIDGQTASELHIFVKNGGDAIFINKLPLTYDNIDSYSSYISKWKDSIKEKVIIHNHSGVLTADLSKLLDKIKIISGLEATLTY